MKFQLRHFWTCRLSFLICRMLALLYLSCSMLNDFSLHWMWKTYGHILMVCCFFAIVFPVLSSLNGWRSSMSPRLMWACFGISFFKSSSDSGYPFLCNSLCQTFFIPVALLLLQVLLFGCVSLPSAGVHFSAGNSFQVGSQISFSLIAEA